MKITKAYEDLLNSLAKNLDSEGSAPNATSTIFLRHDVDYDLKVALRLASHEASKGIKAHYYLLPTAEYWNSSFLIPAARELEALGHEVGLHNNSISQWVTGEASSPYEALREQLELLRDAGVKVDTISSHGDRLCYELGFNNAWLFDHCWDGNSLKKDWQNLSAEGVKDHRAKFQIKGPLDKFLRRPDGQCVELGETSLKVHRLLQDVTLMPGFINITDSGGNWQRGGPEMLSGQQSPTSVLLHPEYWVKQESEFIFILACARSGTKWLRDQLTASTQSRVTHEYILNNIVGDLGQEHLTSSGIALLDKEKNIKPALKAAKSEFATADSTSWIELNVYVPHYIDLLKSEVPNAKTVALFRHPRAVVASLLKRGWFETTIDVNHIQPHVSNWSELNQFERVCHYVAQLNLTLIESCSDLIRLEDLTKSPQDFQVTMAKAGLSCEQPNIEHFARRVDASWSSLNFSLDQDKAFGRILGDICSRLGYGLSGEIVEKMPVHKSPALVSNKSSQKDIKPFFETILSKSATLKVDLEAVTRFGIDQDGKISEKFAQAHTHLVLGGSSWDASIANTGWPASQELEYVVRLEVAFESKSPVNLMLLEYIDGVRVAPPRKLLRVKEGEQLVMFKCKNKIEKFDLAVYASAGASRVNVLKCSLFQYEREFVPVSPNLLFPNT